MRRVLRLALIGGGVLLLGLGAAFAYFAYAPAAEVPPLSASARRDSLRVDGLERGYVVYLPARLAPHPALLLGLHGSMGNAGQMRRASAYRFEELADAHGFIVVYPEGYEGHWNDCRKRGPYAAKRLGIDDVGFMRALIAHLRAAYGVDTARVFAVGLSNGGHLGYRLALEAPDLVRGVAAVAANLPTAENSDCTPVGGAVAVLILNGTKDPINPFEGGHVTIFGFGNRGSVLSAHESAAYFARRNGIAGVQSSSGSHRRAPRLRLPSVRSGGPLRAPTSCSTRSTAGDTHCLSRAPVFRASSAEPTKSSNGPAEIWGFFARRGETRATRTED